MKLLIVEDNEGLREQMKWALRDAYTVIEAGSSRESLDAVKRELPRLVCLDMGLDNIPDKGLEIIDALITMDRRIKIIVTTANTSDSLGPEAIKRGAFDYLKKPVDIDQLKVILARAVRLSELESPHGETATPMQPGVECGPGTVIIGACEPMVKIFDLIRKLCRTDVNVLITGESGTGKEVCARAIHYNSNRRDQPFVPINCGAIPETLLESELFGYRKGAFTGAVNDKKGLIRSAENGTVFLDEIGDMPKSLQVKLLRFIDTQTFQPLGDIELYSSDVRIIAATNRFDCAEGDIGALRSDLYYRLSEFEIHLPPLKERGEDVLLLARALTERNREKFSMPKLTLSPRAEKMLLRYGWPGNVRELENKLGRAAILCTNQVIEPDDLHFSATQFHDLSLKAARDMFEKEYVARALQKAGNVIAVAAQALDISRPTLYDLVKKHEIIIKENN